MEQLEDFFYSTYILNLNLYQLIIYNYILNKSYTSKCLKYFCYNFYINLVFHQISLMIKYVRVFKRDLCSLSNAKVLSSYKYFE